MFYACLYFAFWWRDLYSFLIKQTKLIAFSVINIHVSLDALLQIFEITSASPRRRSQVTCSLD